eukprot:CAMPEP_0172390814 /NCGR_PEP_ID=MMETSP1061-20121228/7381_1 /TAXON_ID=37318 /ORGANISM="Pseudo-nitzschia pungens, Strain cf. pungens" /LENGTH=271 /DNA_ID=CAMNT_0013121293 /DNA_START=38 /DNA_END=853 /DNA_ORIENTATION=+
MILLLSFVIDRYLFPSHRRMDRIDHALRWTFRLGLAVLLVTLPDLCMTVVVADTASASASASASADDTDTENPTATATAKPGPDFFGWCSGGDRASIAKALEAHPDWVNARTDNGEACLHLTGIYGTHDVTKLLLEKGADPNIRSTYSKGLRMHPLSWNVYGGHLDNIRLLLEDGGADVNLDFDSMMAAASGSGSSGSGAVAVTALDVLLELRKNEQGDDRFVAIEELLREHGAKTMEEVRLGGGGEETETETETERKAGTGTGAGNDDEL